MAGDRNDQPRVQVVTGMLGRDQRLALGDFVGLQVLPHQLHA